MGLISPRRTGALNWKMNIFALSREDVLHVAQHREVLKKKFLFLALVVNRRILIEANYTRILTNLTCYSRTQNRNALETLGRKAVFPFATISQTSRSVDVSNDASAWLGI